MHESATPNSQPVILVVDDEGDLRRLASRRLTRAGYQVHEAYDGVDGWERALEHRPAALVVDVRMPRMDGIDNAEQA